MRSTAVISMIRKNPQLRIATEKYIETIIVYVIAELVRIFHSVFYTKMLIARAV